MGSDVRDLVAAQYGKTSGMTAMRDYVDSIYRAFAEYVLDADDIPTAGTPAKLTVDGSRLMAAAMALTLGADTFLLLLNDWYGAGVALFCGVQGLYLVRILRRFGRSLWGLRLFLVGAAWAGLWALGLLSPLNLLAAVYFANFLVNACQALSLSMPLFAWGLWLFLLCDMCVGVHNQPELFPGWLAAFAQVGMWLFYLPGQVLLVLSGRKKEDIS